MKRQYWVSGRMVEFESGTHSPRVELIRVNSMTFHRSLLEDIVKACAETDIEFKLEADTWKAGDITAGYTVWYEGRLKRTLIRVGTGWAIIDEGFSQCNQWDSTAEALIGLDDTYTKEKK